MKCTGQSLTAAVLKTDGHAPCASPVRRSALLAPTNAVERIITPRVLSPGTSDPVIASARTVQVNQSVAIRWGRIAAYLALPRPTQVEVE
ncbi:hypothetical protein DPEC_G00299420 [Dallia pectoralis]|uniref:Uncharacterized protein n=1 Tax=Dallia pectoralis TaxID=75939 RepID=A0ACC2FG05_DALPE|nr:hypothetical protein DPEC_G00299420 [Dallia pectoralis]